MASVIKNVWGATIVSKEIERGEIIVYETGIYKAVVVSVRASKYFFLLYIEVERLSWLIVTSQSRKRKVLSFGYSTVNLILGCLPFEWQEFFGFVSIWQCVKQMKVSSTYLQ